MKSRRLMLTLIAGVLVLLWVLWPKSMQPLRVTEEPQGISNLTAASATAVESSGYGPKYVGSTSPKANDVDKTNRLLQLQRIVESKNAPIDFYGEVVDQNGVPLPNVQIKAMIRHLDVSSPGAGIPVQRETDLSGRFDIHGITGDGFDLEYATKQGYELDLRQRSFGPTGGSVGIPVVFTMVQKNVNTFLISGKGTFDIVPDGRKYVIDIQHGAMTTGLQGSGTLIVWAKRPQDITFGQRFSWECGVEVINGGLSEVKNDSQMYFAPTDGYSNAFHFEQSADQNGWSDSTGTRAFYLKLKNGTMYGRISIEALAYFNDKTPGLIRLEYVVNPSGSQVLR